ncbi:MAG TPA: pyridoxal-dependent decarboxylase [Cyclobacteriaceae bacterium]|nr:pyridoxal-dependent decarboxylase [Cyclobacteriaceae bacterium]
MMDTGLEDVHHLLRTVADYGAEYVSSIDQRTLCATLPLSDPEPLPETGIGSLKAFELFQKRYESLLTARSGPRFLGYINGSVTPAALAGDWLTSVYDFCPQMGTEDPGDLSAFIELETLDLIKQLLGLPAGMTAGFVTGATMASFTGLAVARQWIGMEQGLNVAQRGLKTQATATILSCQPHSSIGKAVSMLGMGRENIVILPPMPNSEIVNLELLEETLKMQYGKPVIFSASAGTVNTGSFDDIAGLVKLKKKYSFWLHIDAAFGGFAACSPRHKHLLNGWNEADSITVDTHKWMNLPYDSGIVFINEIHSNLQREVFQNVNAAYLGSGQGSFKFNNFFPENSRRLRALPAWLSLIAYGRNGFGEMIDERCRLARVLGHLIERSEFFGLLSPVILNIVCFTLKDDSLNVASFLESINKRGLVYLSPTTLYGKAGIRAAFANWKTTMADVNRVWIELNEVVQSMQYHNKVKGV